MDSKELYRQLLRLEAPWTVEQVSLDLLQQRVDVHLGYVTTHQFECPLCGLQFTVTDHVAECERRHLDSCQFLTYVHAQVPRVHCPQHGIQQVVLPLAPANSRFTPPFEVFAMNVLLAAHARRAANILRISWNDERAS